MKLKPFRRKLRWGFVRYARDLGPNHPPFRPANQGISLRVYTKFPGGVMWFFYIIWGQVNLWVGWHNRHGGDEWPPLSPKENNGTTPRQGPRGQPRHEQLLLLQ